MPNRRRLMLELMEDRRVMAVIGPVDPANSPAWQAVIVELKHDEEIIENTAQDLLFASSGRLDQTFHHALRGFAARLPKESIETLRLNPLVANVEIDLPVQALAQTVPSGVRRIAADDSSLTAPINGVEELMDVDIAIIDSGIDRTHPDLNVAGGVNFAGGSSSNFNDGFGHGTHVAGIAAARDNDIGTVGVAPGARLWAVRVLGNTGSGSLSNIIKGVDWVTANAATIEVANMSLGVQGVSTIFHTAIKNSVTAGVVYVAAAGNEFRDILGGNPGIASPLDSTADTMPAAYPEVATISAYADSDGQAGGLGPAVGGYADDTFADFSNFSNSGANGQSWYVTNNKVNNPQGLGIDLVLPGVGIYSTYKNGGYTTMSGTSMAAPHAAGLIARYIVEHGRATNAEEVYEIRQTLIDQGKPWRDPQSGLQFTLPGNSDSPDNFEENLGWAVPAGPVNLAPFAVNDSYLVSEDGSLSISTASGVLFNDSDPENSLLTAQLVSTAGSGTLALAADGSFTYQPSPNFNGSDSFTYRANDGARSSNLATVMITVTPVNDAPTAVADSYAVEPDTVLTIAANGVLSNDSDIDGDSLTVVAWSGNSNQGGQVVLNTDGSFSYTPPSAFTGMDSFSYVVSDGSLNSTAATVSIDVQASLGNPMYVYDIRFESRSRGSQQRAVVEIRWDSNGDGQGNSLDQPLAGAAISVAFAGRNFSGVTDSNGLFRTSWLSNPGSGTYADVIDLALADYVWDPLALDLEDDSNNDGRPDASV